MPNLDVWREYESKKDAFMDNLYTKIKKRAEKREEKENKELGIVNKIRQVQTRPLTKKEIEAHELVNIQGLTQTEAARRLGVSKVCIHNRMNSINRKTQIIMKPLIVNNKTPARSKLIDRNMIENFPSQEKGLNSSNSIDNNVQKEV